MPAAFLIMERSLGSYTIVPGHQPPTCIIFTSVSPNLITTTGIRINAPNLAIIKLCLGEIRRSNAISLFRGNKRCYWNLFFFCRVLIIGVSLLSWWCWLGRRRRRIRIDGDNLPLESVLLMKGTQSYATKDRHGVATSHHCVHPIHPAEYNHVIWPFYSNNFPFLLSFYLPGRRRGMMFRAK